MVTREKLPAAERPAARELAARLTADGRRRWTPRPVGRWLRGMLRLLCQACGGAFYAMSPRKRYCCTTCKRAVHELARGAAPLGVRR